MKDKAGCEYIVALENDDEYFSDDNNINFYKCGDTTLSQYAISDCKKCEFSLEKMENKCTSCDERHFLDNNKCNVCPTNCKEHIEGSCKCKTCEEGQYLDSFYCKNLSFIEKPCSIC